MVFLQIVQFQFLLLELSAARKPQRYGHRGMDEAMKRLKPKNVLVYGGDIGYDFKGANVKYYDNHVTEKMKLTKGDKR